MTEKELPHLKWEKLNLREDELAFYDALEVNDSAVKVLGDEELRKIAQELAQTIRNNISIDWTLKESVQAKLRVTWLSTRQAKEGYRYGIRTSCLIVQRLDRSLKCII